MTGLPGFNFPLFREAARYLRIAGNMVTNPVDEDLVDYPDIELWPGFATGSVAGSQFDLGRAMGRNFVNIVAADALALLPGWENSKGTRAERFVAEQAGKVILLLGYDVLDGRWKVMRDPVQRRCGLPAADCRIAESSPELIVPLAATGRQFACAEGRILGGFDGQHPYALRGECGVPGDYYRGATVCSKCRPLCGVPLSFVLPAAMLKVEPVVSLDPQTQIAIAKALRDIGATPRTAEVAQPRSDQDVADALRQAVAAVNDAFAEVARRGWRVPTVRLSECAGAPELTVASITKTVTL